MTQLIVLDMLGQFPGNRNKLRITQTAVSYFTLKELMRLSFTCKRLYIILGDQLILKRFTDSQTKGLQARISTRRQRFGNLLSD